MSRMAQNTFEGGMVADVRPLEQPQGTYPYALNFVVDEGVLQTEPIPKELSRILGNNGAEYFWQVPIDDQRVLLLYRDGVALRLIIVRRDGDTQPFPVSILAHKGSAITSAQAVVRANDQGELIAYISGTGFTPCFYNLNTASLESHPIFAPTAGVRARLYKSDTRTLLKAGRYYIYYRLRNRYQRGNFHYAGFIDLTTTHTDDGALSAHAIGIDLTMGSVSERKYDKIEFGVVAYYNEEREVYTTEPVRRVGSNDYQIVGSEQRYEVNIQELLVPPLVIKEARVIGEKNNHLLLGNVNFPANDDFQRYVNRMRLRYTTQIGAIQSADAQKDGYFQVRSQDSFQPGEVYAFSVRFHYLDGRTTIPYHLPGNSGLTTYPADSSTSIGGAVRGFVTDFGYPEGFDGQGLTSTKVTHHLMPDYKELQGFRNVYVEAYNLSLPTALQDKLSGWELLYASRENAGIVIDNGYLFGTWAEVSVQDDTKTIYRPLYPGNPKHTVGYANGLPIGVEHTYGYAGTNFESGQGHLTRTNDRTLWTFMGADIGMQRTPLNPTHITQHLYHRHSEDAAPAIHRRFNKADSRDRDGFTYFIRQGQVWGVLSTGDPNLSRVTKTGVQEAIYVDHDSILYNTHRFNFYPYPNTWEFNNSYQEATVLLQTDTMLTNLEDFSHLKRDMMLPYAQLRAESKQVYGPLNNITYEGHGDVKLFGTSENPTIMKATGDVRAEWFEFFRQDKPRDAMGRLNDTRSRLGYAYHFKLPVHSKYLRYRSVGEQHERYDKSKVFDTNDVFEGLREEFEAAREGSALLEFRRFNYFKTNPSTTLGKELRSIQHSYDELLEPLRFEHRFYFTGSNDGESSQDPYLGFLANNYQDLPSRKGQLVRFFHHRNQIFAHMQGAYYGLHATSKQMRADDDTVYLGTGALFSLPADEQNASQQYQAGISDARHAIETPYGYYFVDTYSGAVFQLLEGLKDITRQGIPRAVERTGNEDRFRLGFDPRFARLIVTYLGDGSVSYDVLRGVWVSEHSHRYDFFLPFSDRVLAIKDTFTYDLQENSGQYPEAHLRICVNQDRGIEKTWEHVELESQGMFDKWDVSSEYYSVYQDFIQWQGLQLEDPEINRYRMINGRYRWSVPKALPQSQTGSTLRHYLKGNVLEMLLAANARTTSLKLHYLLTAYRPNVR